MRPTKEKQREYFVKYKNKVNKSPLKKAIRKRKNHDKWIEIKKDPIKFKRYKDAVKRWRSTTNGIYVSLRNRGRKDFNLKKEVFVEWYDSQIKKCVYCNLSLEEIRKLPPPYNRKNGLNKFSIDRKDNNRGYEIDNISLSCFTCNTIKNNFLTFEEMLKTGREIIEPKLRLLLKQTK